MYDFLIFMSKFMRTVSDLEQNFRAALEKPAGLPSSRVEEDSPGVWLPADTKRGRQALTPGDGVGHRERHFRQLKGAFLYRTALASNAPQL